MANFVVVNDRDSGVGSLRQAVANANRSPGLDTISLTNSVTLDSAIKITDSVAIVGISSTIITQTGEDYLFRIDDGDLHNLSEVSFSGISFTGGNGTAIFSQENLNLSNAELFNNVAIDDYYDSSAAIHVNNATLNLDRTSIYENNGGISSSQAEIKIADSNISNNRSDNFISQGSGINLGNGSSLELVNSLVSNNVAGYSGGGISVSYGSQAEISNSTITGNRSEYRGGGISIFDGSLKLTNSTINNNYAYLQSGGIDVSYDSQIEIAQSVISGNTVEFGEGGGISVYADSQARIVDSIVDENAASDGAGINVRSDSYLELSDSTITGNTADYRGGGISVSYDSSLNLASSTITHNTADSNGGGILVYSNSQAEISNSTITSNTTSYNAGGGVSVRSGSSLELSDSDVTDNISEYRGGGIGVGSGSSLNVANSSIVENTAFFGGGGISVYYDSQAEISNSTITGNTAFYDGGGGISSYYGINTIALINTQVTGNSSDNIRGEGVREIVTQRIEAEDLTDSEGYRLETRSIASGGKLLSLRSGKSGEVGKVSFNFTGIAGNYNVKIGTYDEDDGEATIQFDLEGDLAGSVVLDRNPGGLAVSANTQVTRTVATNVSIAAGDLLTFTGFEESEEHARIDFIELEPVSSLYTTNDDLHLDIGNAQTAISDSENADGYFSFEAENI